MSKRTPMMLGRRLPRPLPGWRTIAVSIAVGLALLVLPARARADAAWGWSPGVKLSWTFGRGVTYGFELSFVRLPDLDLKGDHIWDVVFDGFGQVITETYGIVLTLDTDFSKTFRMRVGGEWVGPAIGLEVGPALVVDERGTNVGIGFVPWVGCDIYGFYAFTWILSKAPNLHEMGLILKSPLLSFEGGGAHDDDWDD